MAFRDEVLAAARPTCLRDVLRAAVGGYHPSPADWREVVLYFLLPERFSDGREGTREPLDRSDLAAARPAQAGATAWRWDLWSASGGDRWQGGTICGITLKLDYLKALGATTLWVGPVFKQRGHLDSYHGYGIQDFFDVDPRFGTRRNLVNLVAAAHGVGIRVILDVIFNHTGPNFDYQLNGRREAEPPHRPWPGFYPDTAWRDRDGDLRNDAPGSEDGVWPGELQNRACHTRAGTGSLGVGAIEDDRAEHKRTDFLSLRDLNFDPPGGGTPDPRTLGLLVRCYSHWIVLTDCDRFRLDTLKHVSFEQGGNFYGAIKEFAARLGKHDFFPVGEGPGGDFAQGRYLEALGMNLIAALDIGEMRLTLTGVAKGLAHSAAYFRGFDAMAELGSRRNLGRHHVSILDDHDHVFLHGWRLWSFTFRNLLPHLAGRFECVLIDLFGGGDTEWTRDTVFAWPGQAASVKSLLEELGFNGYFLFGQDSGAMIARHLCLLDRRRVRKLVMTNTEVPHHRPPYLALYRRLTRLPGAGLFTRLALSMG